MSFWDVAPAGSIIQLRQLLAERFPQTVLPVGERLATGITPIDDLIAGGLPKSAITELTSPNPSAGTALIVHALLQTAQSNGFFLALVDGRDSFDPATSDALALRHLLWLRCRQASEAVQAADLLLRDGNFPLVILDLVLNTLAELRKIPQTHWYRLQRLVEATPTVFLVLTRRSLMSSAHLKLSLDNVWDLRDFETSNLTMRLQVNVDRVHGGREILARAG